MSGLRLKTIRTSNRKTSRAFTLIELLAAITILMVIVSIMGVIFAETDRAWHLGTGRVESNNEGRAALNMIAHDLQYALADEYLFFTLREDIFRPRPGGVPVSEWPVISYGFTNSEACFISLQQDAQSGGSPAEKRATREIYYWMRQKTDTGTFGGAPLGRYELVRTSLGTYRPSSGHNAYGDIDWYHPSSGASTDRHTSTARGTIADNVTAFGLFAPDDTGYISREYYSEDYGNRLPEYVDIFLEVLSDKDAIQAADLKQRYGSLDSRTVQFVERHARRYTTRVFPQNRSGYRSRL